MEINEKMCSSFLSVINEMSESHIHLKAKIIEEAKVSYSTMLRWTKGETTPSAGDKEFIMKIANENMGVLKSIKDKLDIIINGSQDN